METHEKCTFGNSNIEFILTAHYGTYFTRKNKLLEKRFF